MNYVLQVVRGRSASTTLKLADGVTSIGRHDDCLIRIKSSQVSRRHCEVFEVADKLTIRDLGSSNGTFVNGKKVSGQQALKPGDELTVGRGDAAGGKARPARRQPRQPGFQAQGRRYRRPRGHRRRADDEQEEFEMEFDDGDPEPEVEGIPLADEDDAKAGQVQAAPRSRRPTPAPAPANGRHGPGDAKEDDAIAQFLLDLKLDDEE